MYICDIYHTVTFKYDVTPNTLSSLLQSSKLQQDTLSSSIMQKQPFDIFDFILTSCILSTEIILRRVYP